MLILALDTSAGSCGVAVALGEHILVEYAEQTGHNHSVRLLPLVAAALAAAGRDKRELAGIAVTSGPGSFTGLRIGLTAAKVLSAALGVPLAAVPTLEALAYQAGPRPGLVSPVLDARRRIYAALYRWEGPNLAVVRPPAACTPAAWLAVLRSLDDEVYCTGDAVPVLRALAAEAPGPLARFAPADSLAVRPGAVAALGYHRLSRGDLADPLALVPLYLNEEQFAG